MAVYWPIFPQKHDVHGPKTLIIFRAADFREERRSPVIVTWKTLRRHVRRFHRVLSAALVSLYIVSGLLILSDMDPPRLQGWIHIGLGVCHWLLG
jgi:hypothetical protein